MRFGWCQPSRPAGKSRLIGVHPKSPASTVAVLFFTTATTKRPQAFAVLRCKSGPDYNESRKVGAI